MRSLISSFLVLTLVLGFTSCSRGEETSSGANLNAQGSQGIAAKATNILWGRYQDYNKSNVDSLIESGDKKFLVYTYSPTCTDCRKTTLSIIKAFSFMKRTDILGFKYTPEQDRDFEKAHNLKVGTLVVMKGNEEIARKEGIVTEEEIISMLK
ncbi:MAG: thioredoxin family protein [Candidatus Gracilibacteria bacterium]